MSPITTSVGTLSVGVQIGGEASGRNNDWSDVVDFVRVAERLGVDSCWSGEAWGRDAVTPLAYLAAVTDRITLGTSIMQISARVPAVTAMTAMTMAAMSNNRFILGLGVSGPQVVEGLHGVTFAQPLRRLRETVEIVRMAFAGEQLAYDGTTYQLPLRGGEGKALRLAQRVTTNLPIYLATLGPRSLEYTGEVADGWIGSCFSPDFGEVFLDAISAGAARVGRTLADVRIDVPVPVAIGEDDEAFGRHRARLAFTLGAMGSRDQNFYNAAYQRAGWGEAAVRVQRLWFDGKRDRAVAAVPDELVVSTSLFGTEATIRQRLRAYQEAGVSTLRLMPAGDSYTARLDTVGRVLELVREVNRGALEPEP